MRNGEKKSLRIRISSASHSTRRSQHMLDTHHRRTTIFKIIQFELRDALNSFRFPFQCIDCVFLKHFFFSLLFLYTVDLYSNIIIICICHSTPHCYYYYFSCSRFSFISVCFVFVYISFVLSLFFCTHLFFSASASSSSVRNEMCCCYFSIDFDISVCAFFEMVTFSMIGIAVKTNTNYFQYKRTQNPQYIRIKESCFGFFLPLLLFFCAHHRRYTDFLR